VSRHRPPQPPRGVYSIGNRLLEPIPSVPELQAYRDKLLAYTFLRGLDSGLDDGWYSVMRELERAEQALDDARWRLACTSWSWSLVPRVRDVPLGEEMFWFASRMIEAARFEERLSGYRVPGKELVPRSKAQVVA